MSTYIYIPHPPLSSVIECFWFEERDTHRLSPIEPVLPTGSSVLIINFHEQAIRVYDGPQPGQVQTFRDAIVCGPRSAALSIDMSIPVSLLGVRFKPGGSFPFFTPPANELVNIHASLDVLWGKDAGLVREQLLAASTIDEKFRVLEKALLRKARRPITPRPAITYAIHEFNHGSQTISSITEQIGFSPQWFRRIFREEVGLSPKVYYRVQRFQQSLRLIAPGKDIDWASIALTCGYFDQAHFIHDFQAFTGFSPTAYVSRLEQQVIVSPSDDNQRADQP